MALEHYSCHTNLRISWTRRVLLAEPLQNVQAATVSCCCACVLRPRTRRVLGPEPLRDSKLTLSSCLCASFLRPWTRRILAPDPPNSLKLTGLDCIAQNQMSSLHGQGGSWLRSHCKISSRPNAAAIMHSLAPWTWRLLVPQPLKHVEVTKAHSVPTCVCRHGQGGLWLLSHCRTSSEPA